MRPSIGCLKGTLVGRIVELAAQLPPPETDCLYTNSYLISVQIAAISTLIALLVGYPMAYGIARASPAWRGFLLMLVILPFWTSFLIRVYAWIGILKPEGLLNGFLLWLSVIDQPLIIYFTPTAVYIGIVYSYLPFMIMPLYASLEKLDEALLEAAADLGARPATAFWRVTVPLSLPGVVAGCFWSSSRRSASSSSPSSSAARRRRRSGAPSGPSSSRTATGRSPRRSRCCCCSSWSSRS